MNTRVAFAIGALSTSVMASIAVAGADQPWLEPGDAGKVPGVALVSGLIGAACLGVRVLLDGRPVGEVFQAAFAGWVAGLCIGLPLSCALK